MPDLERVLDRVQQIVVDAGRAAIAANVSPDGTTEPILRVIIGALLAEGFTVARQRNPSGRISTDKLALLVDGSWHAYDVLSDSPLRVMGLNEVPLPNPVLDEDAPAATPTPSPPQVPINIDVLGEILQGQQTVNATVDMLTQAVMGLAAKPAPIYRGTITLFGRSFTLTLTPET